MLEPQCIGMQNVFSRRSRKMSVVQVQATQLQNERAQVGIVGERLAATVALVRALGGGWRSSDLPPAQ